ncbi:MAG: ATPase [Paludibacteraceae bacterium]|nr:ATPase [Paludibacteraceae bacterium]
MILIADSGSTKTHWVLLTRSGQRSDYTTDGINPVFQTSDQIHQSVSTQLLPLIGSHLWIGPIEQIDFYGAGCTPERGQVIREALTPMFRHAQINVGSDMLGAARALLGSERGIACILGTGSNSCLYDGQKIVDGLPAGGFILGDEGSGAVLGRMLVSDILKRQLPDALCQRFYEEYDLDYGRIVERVYRGQMPSRFLAQFSKFVARQIDDYPELDELVKQNFRNFMVRNVSHYTPARDLPVGFVGSIALHYREQLQAVCDELGYHVGMILQDSIDGLVRHSAQSPTAS